MRTRRVVVSFLPIAVMLIPMIPAVVAPAEEGLWLFNNPPEKLLKDKYQFEATRPWLEHLQRCSVRFNSGGSGSFVSSEGLVLTNHHVGADALQKLSTRERDILTEGFLARTRDQEIKCVDLELNVLVSIEDVTDRVQRAVAAGMAPAKANQSRQAVMAAIEQESLDKTGQRSDVVTLYQGGLYHLYRFQKYTDVRLVFAPEQDIAFFGGDPDNFEYPRFDLDVCLFRVYENDKPLRPAHFLKWDAAGVADGDLVFVSGHPGRTNRQNTLAHLEFLRDRAFPFTLDVLRRREVQLATFSERSRENARRAKDDLFGVANSRKARLGGLAGLQDPAVMSRKAAEEQKLRDAVAADPQVRAACGDPWQDIAQTLRVWDERYVSHQLLERGWAFNCQKFEIARTLVRMAEEDAKPNAERLREYRSSNRDSLRQALFSDAPIYDDLETLGLADSLSLYAERTGMTDPLLQTVLAGKSPRQRAAELVAGSQLQNVQLRKQLADGGQAAVHASSDPLIALARTVDAAARKVRQQYEEQVEEPQRQAYARLADARFRLWGTDTYPDATFTLRLSLGVVKGLTDERGQQVPAWTTLGGAYQRAAEHDNTPPFALPKSWLERKDRLQLDTPFNFICTNDVIGGNSGSPVVNRRGEFVGVIFDGNLTSLVWDFIFTAEQGRSLAVDSRAILEALRNVYRADALADELGR
ncbi:MAG: S46 family peptidase [Candidatus Anammoximicrobium sp.]|nr:S46 family peptidase [Candidatus Anammoximicrobium sp.]